MRSRRSIIIVLVVLVLIVTALFFLFKYPIKSIIRDDDTSSTTKDEEQKDDSPFGALVSPIEGDDVDKLLKSRMDSLECVFPENPAPFVTTRGFVPGIKDDASSADDYWILNSVQPVIQSYETFNDTNYFIGALRDSNGACKKIAFALTGNFNVADSSGLFDQSKITLLGGDPPAMLTFDEFSQRFPKGTQIVVYYLGRRPETNLLVPELCNVKPPMSQKFCSLQRVSEIFSKRVMDRKLLTEIFSFPSDLDQMYAIYVAELVNRPVEEPAE